MFIGTGTQTGHYILFYKAKIDSYLGISTVEEFNTWLANQSADNTPVQLAYPLATPTTIDLSPLSIRMLQDTNNIYADCGEILSGKYWAEV